MDHFLVVTVQWVNLKTLKMGHKGGAIDIFEVIRIIVAVS